MNDRLGLPNRNKLSITESDLSGKLNIEHYKLVKQFIVQSLFHSFDKKNVVHL